MERFSSEYTFSKEIALSLFPLSRRSYTISEVYPPNFWDEIRRTILLENLRLLECDVAFLFVEKERARSFVLYLRRLGHEPLSWGIYPIPPQGGTLKTYFYNMKPGGQTVELILGQ